MDDQPLWQPESLPQFESALRRMVSDSHGLPYVPLRSLAEAQACDDGVVIPEGDDGGTSYVICPAGLVGCDEQVLERLLRAVDAVIWPGNGPNSAHVYYEGLPVGASVPGGLGGGRVTSGVWVHPVLQEEGLGDVIRSVISGRLSRMPHRGN